MLQPFNKRDENLIKNNYHYQNTTENEISQIVMWQGNFERSDWFFLGRNFTIRAVGPSRVFFCFQKSANLFAA